MSKAQYSWAFIGICSDRTNSANPAHKSALTATPKRVRRAAQGRAPRPSSGQLGRETVLRGRGRGSRPAPGEAETAAARGGVRAVSVACGGPTPDPVTAIQAVTGSGVHARQVRGIARSKQQTLNVDHDHVKRRPRQRLARRRRDSRAVPERSLRECGVRPSPRGAAVCRGCGNRRVVEPGDGPSALSPNGDAWTYTARRRQ
jgi:hypothetical protein